jgi:hypothetical protein
LISSSSFATTEDDADFVSPIRFAISNFEPGNTTASSGIAAGLGFRFQRDGYFFTPMFRAMTISNLSPLVGIVSPSVGLISLGFITGLPIPSTPLSAFLGLDYASFLGINVKSDAIFRAGVLVNLGSTPLQLLLDIFYGDFFGAQSGVKFPYRGAEAALQLPIDL